MFVMPIGLQSCMIKVFLFCTIICFGQFDGGFGEGEVKLINPSVTEEPWSCILTGGSDSQTRTCWDFPQSACRKRCPDNPQDGHTDKPVAKDTQVHQFSHETSISQTLKFVF